VADDAFDLARPDPAGTIQSLTALGYTVGAAIADLIDNSISAGARCVDVRFSWGGEKGSSVSISDDGAGMTEDQLVKGMTVGGRGMALDRPAADLGRFGMGLKTASFSQARQLVVASRAAKGPWHTRTWDVDHVIAVGDWQLLHEPPKDAAPSLRSLLESHTGSGTIVLWRRLTKVVATGSSPSDQTAQREFLTHVSTVERHLGMVFARYLKRRAKPLQILVNGNEVQPWDPFLSGNRYVERLQPEEPVPGVHIQGYVLPHRSRFETVPDYDAAGGPRGWLDQQGFYVYRKDRLIVAGDWLKMGFRKDERHVLARLVVDLSAELDHDWSIDVRKAHATPPPALLPHMRRLAKATRERAGAVLTHRGNVSRDSRTQSKDMTWLAISRFGRTHFQINREHPLVAGLLSRFPEARPGIRALLSMIDETLPVGLIRVSPEATTTLEPGLEEAPAAVLELAREVLDALVAGGTSPREALKRVTAMPPFDAFPELGSHLSGTNPEAT
jgi:hypothetical protein